MLRTNTQPPLLGVINGAAVLSPLRNDNGMERIWCLSIRHTGTHYLFERLRSLGYNDGYINWSMRKLVKPKFPSSYFIHSHIEVTPSYQYMTDERCVMPMRNPIEVYRSHVYRYSWTPEQLIAYIQHAFRLFDKLAEEHNAFVFKVDVVDQYGEASRLASWLNAPMRHYKELSRTFHGTRGIGECHNPELFSKPVPKEIRELAIQHGY